jgi:hypothetical protein
VHELLPNTIDYVEIPSLDLAATKTFFASLFVGRSSITDQITPRDDGRMTGGFLLLKKPPASARARR